MRGPDYYRGTQRFRVPRSGRYNITVAGAAGGRGMCSTSSGRGLVWRGTVTLSKDQDLIILVGQRGIGPCDETVTRVQELSICQNPPANLTEVQTCEQEWRAWIANYSSTYILNFVSFVGGGGGGGASFILPVTREGERANSLPIVIAPGGGGSAAVERHDFFDIVHVPSSDNVSDAEQYLLLINAQSASSPSIVGAIEGSRGFVNTSNVLGFSLRPGAGGGWNSKVSGINIDGNVLGSQIQPGTGGQGCSETIGDQINNVVPVPIQNVNGGFGGGGGQCGGGGAGGGYTGGTVITALFSVPSGGGYLLSPQEPEYDNSSFAQHGIDLNPGEDGYVDIVPVDCGCAYNCTVHEEMFKCDCPDDFQSHPNEVDCFQRKCLLLCLLCTI